jgi:hypothetical protein
MLRPTSPMVFALASYVALAFAVTVVIGDLGDVGFWIVWIPLVVIVVYLAAAGVTWLASRARDEPRRPA